MKYFITRIMKFIEFVEFFFYGSVYTKYDWCRQTALTWVTHLWVFLRFVRNFFRSTFSFHRSSLEDSPKDHITGRARCFCSSLYSSPLYILLTWCPPLECSRPLRKKMTSRPWHLRWMLCWWLYTSWACESKNYKPESSLLMMRLVLIIFIALCIFLHSTVFYDEKIFNLLALDREPLVGPDVFACITW